MKINRTRRSRIDSLEFDKTTLTKRVTETELELGVVRRTLEDLQERVEIIADQRDHLVSALERVTGERTKAQEETQQMRRRLDRSTSDGYLAGIALAAEILDTKNNTDVETLRRALARTLHEHDQILGGHRLPDVFRGMLSDLAIGQDDQAVDLNAGFDALYEAYQRAHRNYDLTTKVAIVEEMDKRGADLCPFRDIDAIPREEVAGIDSQAACEDTRAYDGLAYADEPPF